MIEKCHEIEDFGELEGFATDDPRLLHVRECSCCRSRLASYQRFVAGIPDKSDADRESDLAAWLTREIHGSNPAVANGSSSSAVRVKRFLSRRMLSFSLATAAVFVLFISFQQYRSSVLPEAEIVTRSDSPEFPTPDFRLASRSTPDMGMELTWRAAAHGGNYRVVIYSAALQEIASFETGTETSLVLSAEQLAELQSGSEPMLWRVQVVARGVVVAPSAPGVISAIR